MITVTIKTNEGLKKEVNIRKTLSGDFILREHPEIDIIVMPEKSKVLVLPKEDTPGRRLDAPPASGGAEAAEPAHRGPATPPTA